ncbi:vegetative cell wall protein gp1-like [Canis lupus familiaris]|uniref:vegetative cell wall protein gp1-like n=1 Tax=Canis lupus familiaris TaxID=9615 RepID=UPI0018F2C46B|nr:vegetative cell wall protein gp1-like [Canis lupus familiaris]
MTQLRRMRCDLPRPAGPEEFPTRPLGLERVSLAPGPLLPSPASETLPRVEEQASPGPATQPEPPGTPPGQAIVQLLLQRWNSLPILPVQQDGAGRRPPDMVSLKTKNGVPFPSAPAWATPKALRRTRPWSTPGTPITGSPQPPRDDAVGPRTPFLPCGHCSSCPLLGSDGQSQGGAEPAAPRPRTGPGPSALHVHGAARCSRASGAEHGERGEAQALQGRKPTPTRAGPSLVEDVIWAKECKRGDQE